MEDDDLPTPALEAARGRRLELHAALVDTEQALAAPAPGRASEWARDVLDRLEVLRAAFDRHVEVTEGPGGLYDEIRERAPRLLRKLESLRAEHPAIGEAIAGALARVAGVSGGEDVTETRAAVLAVLARLARHRQAGSDLVYEAYNVDVGAGD